MGRTVGRFFDSWPANQGLDRDETLPRKILRHHYDRLGMLPDGVFAITLLVLDVRPPLQWSGDLFQLVTNSCSAFRRRIDAG